MTADLPVALRLIYHRDEPAPRDIPLEHVYADLTFPPREPLPFVALNMVQTLDGAAAIGGRAWTIGTAVDHYLYRTLHGAVDAVLAGAGTLRAEDVVAGTHTHLRARREAAGLPRTPTAVALTAAASFDEAVLGKRFFTGREYPSLLLTTARARPADIERSVRSALRWPWSRRMTRAWSTCRRRCATWARAGCAVCSPRAAPAWRLRCCVGASWMNSSSR